ncbi:hypothetical protein GGX14DRAFT_397602 [Mycena pura]|uniref:Uncharacterized protein n=1 Tax=Mycena pura TaxID=153505 RepID=A0AAD6YCD8_9AGAR|nr:hypothetical protein GGX14DRAFT_397602 [Mycena pura]
MVRRTHNASRRPKSDVNLSGYTSTLLPSASLASSQPRPSRKINSGAIAGGVVCALFVVGAAIALFLCLRIKFRHRRAGRPILRPDSRSIEQLEAPSLTVMADGQTMLALDRPIVRGVVETQGAMLRKATHDRRQSRRVRQADAECPAAASGGNTFEMQVGTMAERMTLVEAQMQVRSLEDEHPPEYTSELANRITYY